MKCIILLLLCCLVAPVFAQNYSLLVLDKETGKTIPGCQVEVSYNDPVTQKTNKIIGQTDASGAFSYEAFYIKNNATFLFTHAGYQQTARSTFQLVEQNYRVALSPSTISIDEVVVSASRFEEPKKDVPREIITLYAKQIAFANQQTTADLLQNSGAVFVQKSQMGGGSPVMRGFEANKVLIVIDGVRMNNAIYRGGHLQNVLRIDQFQLDQTELFFGPGSVMYGSDAFGGVMHFRTRKPQLNKTGKMQVSGSAAYRFGSVNNEQTAHADVQLSGTRWASITSITASDFGDLRQGKNRNANMGTLGSRDSVQQRIQNQDVALANDPLVQSPSGYQQFDVLQKILFAPNKVSEHIVNIQFSTTNNVPRYDRLTEKNKGSFSSAEWYYGPETRLLASYHFHSKRRTKAWDEARLITSYQYIEESRHNRSFGSNTKTHRNEYVHVYAANIDLSKKIARHEIRYGSELAFNDVISNANRENIVTGKVTSQSTRYPDGGSSMFTAAAYATHSWELSPKWILSDGLRINHVGLQAQFQNKTFYPFLPNTLNQQHTALNGQAGVVFLPGKQWKLNAAFATGFRAPNIDDVGKIFDSQSGVTAILPNPNLNPEYNYSLEAGLQKTFRNKVQLEWNAYYTIVTNLIALERSSRNGSDSVLYDGKQTLIVQSANMNQAYVYGTGMQLRADLTEFLTFNTSIQYTYGRIKTDSTDYPLDHIPPVYGKTSLQLVVRQFRAEAFTLYNGWKRIQDYNLLGEDNQQYATAKGMPAWYTLNLRLGYSILVRKQTIQVNAGCENILDRNYRTFASGISAPGRNLFVSVRYLF